MTDEIVIENAGEKRFDQVPGRPDRIVTGSAREDFERNIQEAIRADRDGSRGDGDMLSDGPFGVFSEWAGAADSADYADL